jgi:hypothetical protein
MREYHYSQISPNSIRLLRLLPSGKDTEFLHGELLEYPLQATDTTAHPYEALSYVWGSENKPKFIAINNQRLYVTQNLYTVLLHLRDHLCSQPIWVDAICINQSDELEKSSQVKRMRDIFAKASKVIAWIGEPDQLSSLAFDTLERFAAEDGTLNGSVTCRNICDNLDKRELALRSFTERPYFTRVWIVQEIVVARRVNICSGNLSLDLDMITRAVGRMTGCKFYPFTPAIANLSYVGRWRTDYQTKAHNVQMETLDSRLFLDSRYRSATDARDKIYSLRGITNDAISSGIEVNYANSVEKVYIDFTKLILQIRPDLLILSAVIGRHRKLSRLSLPSYVPDRTLPSYGGGILQRYFRFKETHWFKAAMNTIPKVHIEDDSRSIRIQGLQLDMVQKVINVNHALGTKNAPGIFIDEQRIKRLAADAISADKYKFSEESSWVAFFRTVSADRTALSPRINDAYRSQFFQALGDWASHKSRSTLQDLPEFAWAALSKEVGTIIEDKEIFVTEQGYLGIAHEGIAKGDTVCIFSGGEVPFLVRKRATSASNHFEFLSECYVHGVMDGEAFDDDKKGRLEMFTIF